jgi:soluble lytic murein transglycosylase
MTLNMTKNLTPLSTIVAWLGLSASVATTSLGIAAPVHAQSKVDDVIVEMSQAFKKLDRKRLSALLPQTRGHALESYAAYWEMNARLNEATTQELQDVLQRHAGTYQEDRLRNDWLLMLGQRRDWATFTVQYPLYRMNDDREVRCYALHIEHMREPARGAEIATEVRRNWYGIRDADDGCTLAAASLFDAKHLNALDVWREARLSMEANRARAAANAVTIVAPDAVAAVSDINNNPARFLTSRATAIGSTRKELVTLALIKLATKDPDAAALSLDSKWSPHLTAEERSWAWGVIGKQSALNLSFEAGNYFANTKNEYLTDDLLAWKTRTALRATEPPKGWPVMLAAINAMSDDARKDPTWVYWKARALRGIYPATHVPTQMNTALGTTTVSVLRPELHEAHTLLESIASSRGFYEMLAAEELGQRISAPERPTPSTAEEREAAQQNAGLQRALTAIALGVRPEGVREWNYSTNLHAKGGMKERELLAAAQLACEREVWDRCISSSDRTKTAFDAEQRFPMPFKDAVVRRSRELGLDPAYVYGLIRQESRFVMDARSDPGASGLMQIMPTTARWTAKKIGLDGFTTDQLGNRDTNIAIGTAYLKFTLDDFAGSMPLATAAYNAGPSRSRAWRNGVVMEAAAWAENVPFAETRDYVKKVLANTTLYAALLTGQPQSIKARLGSVGPREASAPEVNKDLP